MRPLRYDALQTHGASLLEQLGPFAFVVVAELHSQAGIHRDQLAEPSPTLQQQQAAQIGAIDKQHSILDPSWRHVGPVSQDDHLRQVGAALFSILVVTARPGIQLIEWHIRATA
jgi:hypothetical protein